MSDKAMEIVLCVPGPWTDKVELFECIAKNCDDYIYIDTILTHLESTQSFELAFEGPDERMLLAFETAGPHWKNTPEMKAISTHKSVCYLIANGGSVESAHSIMNAANALLSAGGFGVKVESSGLAHPPKDWQEQCKFNYLFKSHSSYVVYIESENTHSSCGMHNFGLPDAIVNSGESGNPSELLRAFTHYLLSESPTIVEGQTFSVDADSPVYRIKAKPTISHDQRSLFDNPFGMWQLHAC